MGAAEAAAYIDLEAGFAGGVAFGEDADVVHAHGGAIDGTAGDGDLEFARQVGEFRMVGGPLAQDLRKQARVDDFIARGTREMIGGDVAHAVAAGLDGMQVRFGERGEDLRRIVQTHPVDTGCSAAW